MINKNGKCISKLGICLNILLHYGKYQKIVGKRVKIVKNEGLPKYNNIVGKIGVVTDFEYINFSKPIVVYFANKRKEYCFSFDELEIV